jgi:crossover junction endodeoxyribonuclease RusA
MKKAQFFIPGIPATAGSKRGFPIRRKDGSLGVAMTHDNKRAKPWMSQVASVASEHFDSPLDGPCSLHVTFVFSRPKSHYGSGKNANTVKGTAPAHKTSKPDCSKLIRCLEDGLTGIAYRDDSQVVELSVEKRYGEQNGAIVQVIGR